MTVATADPVEQTLDLFRTDTPYWCRKLAFIRAKDKRIIRFEPNAGQLRLEEMLAEQRAASQPQRAIALKARRVGVSTYVQAKLIQGGTLTAGFDGICLAHDRDTGAKLYAIGERMYLRLPNDKRLKPPRRHYGRGKLLSWGEQQADGSYYPDSSYFVDTAGESQAGRGGAASALHASEYAFWPNPVDKLIALLSVIPDEDPDSLVVIESTANGNNDFKDRWDDAVAGVSGYAPFFWPWWKDETYTLSFSNEAERERFIAEVGTGPYGEDEPALLDPGPVDTFTGENVPLTLEQLHWRRRAIASRTAGKLMKFKQEYPATPDEAFLSSGRKVFDAVAVGRLRQVTVKSDPRLPTKENPGPFMGALEVKETTKMVGRHGALDVPTEGLWKPSSQLGVADVAGWKVWLKCDGNGIPRPPKPDVAHVIGVDVSEGIAEGEDKDDDPAYHAIEVIDHKTGRQVAEYRSRIDNDLLAREVLLAALFFNDPWVAIEKTGFYGLPVLRRLYHDFHYMGTYFRKSHDQRSDEKVSDRLGWDTNPSTKPILLSLAEEMLRTESTGIQSHELAGEMQSYVRAAKTAKTMPERGRFADLLMAWCIAQQVRQEKPPRTRAWLSGPIHTAPNLGPLYSGR